MRKLLYILATVALAWGCVGADDISFGGIDDIQVRKMTAVDVHCTAANRSGTTVTLREARFTIRGPASRIGEVMLAGPVRLDRRSSGVVVLPFRLRAADPIAFVSLVEGDDPARFAGLTVSGTVRVGAGLFGRKIALDNIPLSEIVNNFDGWPSPAGTDD